MLVSVEFFEFYGRVAGGVGGEGSWEWQPNGSVRNDKKTGITFEGKFALGQINKSCIGWTFGKYISRYLAKRCRTITYPL